LATLNSVGRPRIAWDEVDGSFQRFRESAVRLVERVNDLMGNAEPAPAPADDDLRLVRSVFGKWSIEIMAALHTAPSFGFEELRRFLPGISPRVLSLKLKDLEQHGLVRRDIVESRPPRVQYTLTDRGWTVAWLADPVLLYIRHLATRERLGAPPPDTGGRRATAPVTASDSALK
jgi:DNA-binding HxlR family transcriptional regulator